MLEMNKERVIQRFQGGAKGRKRGVCVCVWGVSLAYNIRTIKSVAVKVNTKSKLKFAVLCGLHFIEVEIFMFLFRCW